MVVTEGSARLRAWIAAGPRTERSQSAVARAIGVSQPAVRLWIEGATRPEPRHRLALEVLTGIAPTAWESEEERRALKKRLDSIAASKPRQRAAQSKKGSTRGRKTRRRSAA